MRLDRTEKAAMIEAIVTEHTQRGIQGRRILDIGCGNGEISRYLSARGAVQHGVDIVDQRWRRGDFEFSLTEDSTLPYPDDHFDIVISHHVIEHVSDQRLHLAEVKRVLAMNGVAYVATPNRTSPIMEGHVGNERVFHYRDMAPFFESCGFEATLYSVHVAHDPTRYHSEVRWARLIPRPVLRLLTPLFPSQMFILAPADRSV